MSEPCFFCGARADIDCGHRPFDPDWKLPAKPEKRGVGGERGGGIFRVEPKVLERVRQNPQFKSRKGRK